MCNIFYFQKNQMIDFESLENCCFNNWHSFGLVTKVDGRLDIKRVVPKSGEIDARQIWDLLNNDLQYERYLHVRHNTAGKTDLRNCHPFDVYYDESTGEQIVAMHNGTLYEFKSKKWVDNRQVDDDDGPSDTKNFVDQIIIPAVASDFGSGKAALDNPFFKRVMNRFWPSTGSNRLVLISSKQPSLFLGDWKEYGDEKVKVSNIDYFEKVTRGPEFERRRLREEEDKKRIEEQLRKEREAKRGLPVVLSQSVSTTAVTRFNGLEVEKSADLFELEQTLSNFFDDWDGWDREGLVALGYATKDEIEQLYSDKKNCIIAMDMVFTEFAKMHAEMEELKQKKFKAEKKIEELALKMKSEVKPEKQEAA